MCKRTQIRLGNSPSLIVSRPVIFMRTASSSQTRARMRARDAGLLADLRERVFQLGNGFLTNRALMLVIHGLDFLEHAPVFGLRDFIDLHAARLERRERLLGERTRDLSLLIAALDRAGRACRRGG